MNKKEVTLRWKRGRIFSCGAPRVRLLTFRPCRARWKWGQGRWGRLSSEQEETRGHSESSRSWTRIRRRISKAGARRRSETPAGSSASARGKGMTFRDSYLFGIWCYILSTLVNISSIYRLVVVERDRSGENRIWRWWRRIWLMKKQQQVLWIGSHGHVPIPLHLLSTFPNLQPLFTISLTYLYFTYIQVTSGFRIKGVVLICEREGEEN